MHNVFRFMEFHIIRGSILPMSALHKQALNLHLKAPQMRKKVLGNHYQTAGSCYKVACSLRDKGDLVNARQARALHCRQRGISVC